MACQILAYDILDRWISDHGMTRTAFAKKAGLSDRDFRHLMQLKDPERRVSVEFADKIRLATDGAVSFPLWVPVRI